ncbi:CaiB/BaiF CoA transferase family protein [Ramlibacter sp.]|uniref:CaiB/BaiF CoA transferase family protein n=1 Tax=Ramlibacter sp. TaxID=1917967 RepID=UPI003D0CC785
MRVVEIGGAAADFCGMLLAGEGADVVKVEPPEGSPSRGIGPFFEDVPGPDRSLFYWTYNRGKRGVTLDTGSEAGIRRYRELVATADVIVDAHPAGFMNERGLGYSAIQELNPAVVYCSITPFGGYGPWRDFKSSDLVHQALGGSAYCIGYDAKAPGKWDTPPFMAQGWQSFAIAAEHAAVAIAAAFYHRHHSGSGQFIDVAIHDACAQATEGTVPRFIYTQRNQVRSAPQQMKCADGRFLALVVTMLRVANLPKLRELLGPGLGEELSDPRFLDPEYVNSLEANERVARMIARWAAVRPAVEAFNALQQCNVVCAPNRPLEELLEDEHCRERGNFVAIEHPELGRSFTYASHPNLRSTAAWGCTTRAPLLGEHNEEVWRELRA